MINAHDNQPAALTRIAELDPVGAEPEAVQLGRPLQATLPTIDIESNQDIVFTLVDPELNEGALYVGGRDNHIGDLVDGVLAINTEALRVHAKENRKLEIDVLAYHLDLGWPVAQITLNVDWGSIVLVEVPPPRQGNPIIISLSEVFKGALNESLPINVRVESVDSNGNVLHENDNHYVETLPLRLHVDNRNRGRMSGVKISIQFDDGETQVELHRIVERLRLPPNLRIPPSDWIGTGEIELQHSELVVQNQEFQWEGRTRMARETIRRVFPNSCDPPVIRSIAEVQDEVTVCHVTSERHLYECRIPIEHNITFESFNVSAEYNLKHDILIYEGPYIEEDARGRSELVFTVSSEPDVINIEFGLTVHDFTYDDVFDCSIELPIILEECAPFVVDESVYFVRSHSKTTGGFRLGLMRQVPKLGAGTVFFCPRPLCGSLAQGNSADEIKCLSCDYVGPAIITNDVFVPVFHHINSINIEGHNFFGMNREILLADYSYEASCLPEQDVFVIRSNDLNHIAGRLRTELEGIIQE